MSHCRLMSASLLLVIGLSAIVSADEPERGIKLINVELNHIKPNFDGHFDNHFDPLRRARIRFAGTAEYSPGPFGLHSSFLDFQLDYLAVNGEEVTSELRSFEITPGQTISIDEHWDIPSCPSEVSLHLFGGLVPESSMLVTGVFTHECHDHMPEPTSFLAWSLLGMTYVAAGRRPKRNR